MTTPDICNHGRYRAMCCVCQEQAYKDEIAQLKAEVDELRTALSAQPSGSSRGFGGQKESCTDSRDAAVEAVRKQLCKLVRFSFIIGPDGGVSRTIDSVGDWVAFHEVHGLFDPVAVDGAIAAMQQSKKTGSTNGLCNDCGWGVGHCQCNRDGRV